MDNQENIKKVIVVIVEGVSDKVSFEGYLNALCSDKTVFFSVYKGDLMTDYEQDEETTNDILKQLVQESCESSNFRIEDISMVIQIADTDGCFAKDVIQQNTDSSNNDSVRYFEDKILAKNVLSFSKTQEYKKERLLDCLKMSEIEITLNIKIPYEIYYMSCNLECALHNVYNATDEEKADLSEEFAAKFSYN